MFIWGGRAIAAAGDIWSHRSAGLTAVIIERKDWPLWLDEAEGDPASLLHAAPEDVLRLWPVGKAVGNVNNDGRS
jgi:putative SOS response-associated peptidase YedK